MRAMDFKPQPPVESAIPDDIFGISMYLKCAERKDQMMAPPGCIDSAHNEVVSTMTGTSRKGRVPGGAVGGGEGCFSECFVAPHSCCELA